MIYKNFLEGKHGSRNQNQVVSVMFQSKEVVCNRFVLRL